MKKLLLISATTIMLSALMIGCNNSSNDQPQNTATKEIYQCPMHPEEKSDKPGKCPKCGMDLEKVIVPAIADTINK